MTGERDLDALIAHMQPRLSDPVYVFASLPPGAPPPPGVKPLMMFGEDEGTTYVLTRAQAQAHGLAYAFPCRLITLNIHSALDAVGFLAAVTQRLARAGIPVNAVSAFYHDHLFAPVERAQEALALLKGETG